MFSKLLIEASSQLKVLFFKQLLADHINLERIVNNFSVLNKFHSDSLTSFILRTGDYHLEFSNSSWFYLV